MVTPQEFETVLSLDVQVDRPNGSHMREHFVSALVVPEVVQRDRVLDAQLPAVPQLAPRYAGGFLFFVGTDGALQAAPYDPRGTELLGQAVPLVEGLHNTGFTYSYDVSQTGVLVYQLQSEAAASPEIVQVAIAAVAEGRSGSAALALRLAPRVTILAAQHNRETLESVLS